MRIYGAGLAGLLAANVFRKTQYLEVIESQNELPNNHAALLRHRESHIADSTSIPFKKVLVRKGINYLGKFYTQATPKLANMYSHKVTGHYTQRSIWNLDPVHRYIAPADFIEKLAHNVPIAFGREIERADLVFYSSEPYAVPQISTIPMPAMMRMVDYQNRPEFGSRMIRTFTAKISNCDLYQTVYYPNPDLEVYRISITGNNVIAEFLEMPKMPIAEFVSHFLELDFGITDEMWDFKTAVSRYGKIVPIDERIRRDFIQYMTKKFNVYSLGRFATWRNILLDDVYHDINVIKTLIDNDGYYTKAGRSNA